MKTKFKIIFFAFIFLLSFKQTFAYNLTFEDEILVNKYTSSLLKVLVKEEFKTTEVLYSRIDYYANLHPDNERFISILEKIKIDISDYLRQLEEEEKNNSPSNGYESSTNFEELNVNIARVKEIWLGYYNDYRKSKSLSSYSYELILDQTAQEWSDLAKSRGYIDHRRNSGDSYYNYLIIEKWFSKRGVTCKNVSSRTFTENIGYGTFKCNDGDCTDELASAIKKSFNFFVNEGPGGAHYESVVNKYYTKIGLGIAVQDFGNGNYKYYLTTHYCTEIVK